MQTDMTDADEATRLRLSPVLRTAAALTQADLAAAAKASPSAVAAAESGRRPYGDALWLALLRTAARRGVICSATQEGRAILDIDLRKRRRS
jgi:transcriptional regulator with XRE-family HTH domain